MYILINIKSMFTVSCIFLQDVKLAIINTYVVVLELQALIPGVSCGKVSLVLAFRL